MAWGLVEVAGRGLFDDCAQEYSAQTGPDALLRPLKERRKYAAFLNLVVRAN